ncbi:MAG: phosphoribosylamine--glycine ligase [Rickettsiales bacterium]|nr:phosphoribosylamine--glycine ligase [Rickettsiales bacterium]
MRILVIGSGGREHALCYRLAQSPSADTVFCSPGNAGIAECAECVSLDNPEDIVAFCTREKIDLVVVGPEQPLVDGLADTLRAANIATFGPSAKAAALEGSKGFSKDFCAKYNIPTAAYGRFDDAASAIAYVKQQGAPIVVKADGLAAGKGVTVAQTEAEAIEAIEACFDGKFGEAGSSVIVEECLIGEEASFFALCDGEQAREFASAQDHKAVGEGDTGPNTGGMGTYSPAPVMTESMRQRVMAEIVNPTIAGMKAEGSPYQGILFVGLMITANGPKVIEYNCRFGDPETQVMLPRIQGDFAALLHAASTGALDKVKVELGAQAALCVVMAAKGYPGAYEKGSPINQLDAASQMEDVIVFHAGTKRDGDTIVAAGGRVLGVTALGGSIAEAQAKAYAAVDSIDWPDGFCRRDIGWRALERKAS